MSTRQTDISAATPHMTLGTFLRVRRERLAPARAGIRIQSRRRTPGLRREEVAALAAISPEWYTYLEQGRDIHPSQEVIDRIASALQLSPAERQYLRTLAFPKSRAHPMSALPSDLQQFVDDLDYRPAYVVNDLWDMVGWNAAAARLFPGLTADARPNLVTSVFLNPEWRSLYCDWDTNARRMIALFRLTVATHANDERCSALIAELNTCREFSEWWQTQNVLSATAGNKQMRHPVAGELDLDYTSLRTTNDSSLTVIMFRPTDEKSRTGLLRLCT